jgi:hypothetical protein
MGDLRIECSSSSSSSDEGQWSEDEKLDTSISDKKARDSTSEAMLRIVVKKVGKGDGDVLSLEVNPSASVLDLKSLISEQLAAKDDRVSVERQRLIYFGRMLLDNEQTLGSSGIKMKPETINYVHLSPLPEGAKPNVPPTSSRTAAASSSQGVSSLDARLERARRIGVAARERRRRMRNRPYALENRVSSSTSSSRRGGGPVSFAVPQEPPPGLSAPTTSSLPVATHLQLAGYRFFDPCPTVGGGVLSTPSVFSSPTNLSHLSQRARLSQLSTAAIPDIIAEAHEEASSIAHFQLLGEAHQLSSDLDVFVPSLQEILQHTSTPNNLMGGERNTLQTINTLEHISRESSALALVLRRLATESTQSSPSTPPAAAAISARPVATLSNPIALERGVLGEQESDQAFFIPGSSSGPSFPPGMI